MEKNVKLSNRIIAYVLDVLLVYVVLSLVVGIRFINPNYDKYMEEYNKYSEIVSSDDFDDLDKLFDDAEESFYNLNKYGISYNIASVIIIFLYFGVFQKFNNGQTLGKKIMKIKVVDNNSGENTSLSKYLLRLLPLQFIYIGCIIPLLFSSILILFLNSTTYLYSYFTITFIFAIINLVSLFMIIFKKDHRGLHDIIANTKVINE